MTTQRFQTNINCGSCVAAVKPFLDAEPAIEGWSVDTSAPEKLLTVHGDSVPAERVRELVGAAGFRVLRGVNETNVAAAAPEKPKSETYFPLVLIAGYLVGLVALVEIAAGTFDAARAMANFMGGFFLVFSFFKLLDLKGFASSFATYDLVAGGWPMYGLLYPFIELALGIGYVLRIAPTTINIATLIVMGVGGAGVVRSLLQRRKIQCACLGTVFNLPMSSVTLIEDLLMAAMAAAALASGPH